MQWSRIESIHIWEGIRKTEASGTTVTRKHADCGAKINSKPLWQNRCWGIPMCDEGLAYRNSWWRGSTKIHGVFFSPICDGTAAHINCWLATWFEITVSRYKPVMLDTESTIHSSETLNPNILTCTVLSISRTTQHLLSWWLDHVQLSDTNYTSYHGYHGFHGCPYSLWRKPHETWNIPLSHLMIY